MKMQIKCVFSETVEVPKNICLITFYASTYFVQRLIKMQCIYTEVHGNFDDECIITVDNI